MIPPSYFELPIAQLVNFSGAPLFPKERMAFSYYFFTLPSKAVTKLRRSISIDAVNLHCSFFIHLILTSKVSALLASWAWKIHEVAESSLKPTRVPSKGLVYLIENVGGSFA